MTSYLSNKGFPTSFLSLFAIFLILIILIFRDFYATLSPINPTKFSTTLVLIVWTVTLSRDDVLRILSLFNVEDSFFPIITLYLKNLSYLNIPKITYQFFGRGNTYNGGTLTINKDAYDHFLNDIVIIFILPYAYHSTITEYTRHFLYPILNGVTIDLGGMICRTIIFHYATLVLSYLHYPSLINQ